MSGANTKLVKKTDQDLAKAESWLHPTTSNLIRSFQGRSFTYDRHYRTDPRKPADGRCATGPRLSRELNDVNQLVLVQLQKAGEVCRSCAHPALGAHLKFNPGTSRW